MDDIMKESSLTPYLTKAHTNPSLDNLTNIINNALNDPSLFIFGELLDLEGIEKIGRYHVLQVFGFGKLSDLSPEEVVSLSGVERRKIRQLTVVSLSSGRKFLPYDLLLAELAMDNVRELEDVVIDAMYSGLLRGKLNQKSRCLVVDEAMGRDIDVGNDDEFDRMIGVLGGWGERAREVIRLTEEQAENAKKHKEKDVVRSGETKRRLDELSQTLFLAAEMSGGNR